MSALLRAVRAEFGDGHFFEVDELVAIDVEMLERAGCTVADFEHPFERWGRAYRVKDDWPFIRTVMWNRRVELSAVQRGVLQ